jgi:prolyl-tRNA synthetase
VAPFDVHLVATGKDTAVYDIADSLASTLDAAGVDVLFDDRPKVSPGVKFGDAELLGVPRVVVVGRDAAEGFAEVWDRAAGTKDRVALADVPALFTGATAQ